MMPSFLVCLVLTCLAALVVGVSNPVGRPYPTFFGAAAVIWLVQTLRWSYRLCGYNYRLTTRRLYRDRGFSYRGYARADLARVARVWVRRRRPHERLFHLGTVVVEALGQEPLEVGGVGNPEHVASLIRDAALKARPAAEAGGDGAVPR
jgi:hypothetical protein